MRPAPELQEIVQAVFGDRMGTAQRFVDLLASSGTERGLIGPREVDRLWDRHVLNCAALAAWCPPGGDVIDVGSGAGLPGLVLALARPDLSVTLVEPMQRRVDWLHEVVAELGADVRVLRSRAEDSGVVAGTVTARAVAPLERLARMCLPLVAPGGQLLAMKGRSAVAELTAAAPALPALGANSWEVLVAEPASWAPLAQAPAWLASATVVRVSVAGGT